MRLFFFFLLAFSILQAKHCTFMPPADWEIARLKIPSPHVKIGFVGKGSTDFRPSINLATEEVDVSLKEYVKAVKELQSADPKTQWRDLGPFAMQGGKGRLTEMTTSAPWGEIKMLQAFFIADQTAYILTAAVAKEDFLKLQPVLMQSLKSLTLIPDIWSSIPDPEQRQGLQALFASLGEEAWEEWQAQVTSISEPGPYWQFLALQEGRAKIDSLQGESP